MHQTLYRKYRPQTFSEVWGQDRVTAVLREQCREGTTTHAYLFSGTRGTGKTSCAKILARALNCEHPKDGEPCNECETCLAALKGELLDVLEIDAASNNGVENIRKICDDISFLPAVGKKRVFIIDEVHMLSMSAFNALLKTLEEPPEHVLFVLATTELQKVPATIRSRCQSFLFRRISVDDIAGCVMQIAKKENILLQEDGARFLARLADGAMRDALSLLEVCVGHAEQLGAKEMQAILGVGNDSRQLALARALAERNLQESLRLLLDLYSTMSDLKLLLSELMNAFRDMLLFVYNVAPTDGTVRSEEEQKQLAQAARKAGPEFLLYDVSVLEDTLQRFERLSVDKMALIQLAFLKICNPASDSDPAALSARLRALEEAFSSSPVPATKRADPVEPQQAAAPVQKEKAPREAPVASAPPIPEKPSEPSVETKKEDTKTVGSSYAQKVIEELSGNSALTPYFKEITLSEEGNTLVVVGAEFTIRMLASQQNRFLEAAQKHAPHLSRVVFRNREMSAQTTPDDLDSF